MLTNCSQDDIIIFRYLASHVRHLVGIRATMLAMCKQCYPATKVSGVKWCVFCIRTVEVRNGLHLS